MDKIDLELLKSHFYDLGKLDQEDIMTSGLKQCQNVQENSQGHPVNYSNKDRFSTKSY